MGGVWKVTNSGERPRRRSGCRGFFIPIGRESHSAVAVFPFRVSMPHEHPSARNPLGSRHRPVKEHAQKTHAEDPDEHAKDVAHPPGVHDEPAETGVRRKTFRQKSTAMAVPDATFKDVKRDGSAAGSHTCRTSCMVFPPIERKAFSSAGSSANAPSRTITRIWYPVVSPIKRSRDASPRPTNVKRRAEARSSESGT